MKYSYPSFSGPSLVCVSHHFEKNKHVETGDGGISQRIE